MSGTGTSVLLKVPPIAWFVFGFALGFAADAVALAAPHPASADGPLLWIALASMLAGGYFGGGAFALFVARRMQLMPGAPVTRFATDGPFALSRNPMYLGLALLYAGLCLMFGLVLTLALLVVPLAVIALVVIPFEEEEMAASFGDAYAQYRKRVRRWL